MSATDPVVIVGAGHGGFALADTLRQMGYPGPIALIDAQDGLPYQRPPLSKSYLGGGRNAAPLEFRPAEFYARNAIDYLAGDRCLSIDRNRALVTTAEGRTMSYRHLVLATGAEARPLAVRGAELVGVCGLHILPDADNLVEMLSAVSSVVVIGGGFIGLEVAAAARARDIDVTVVEAMPRLMQRSVSAPVSRYVLDLHRAAGTAVRLDSRVVAMHGERGRLRSVELGCGDAMSADLVLVGVGVRPRIELATSAGLDVDDGVVVDEYLRTSDPDISAVGDCCSFPNPLAERPIRLESVQNATDQARCVAARLTGDPRPYRDTPWFWSHQGTAKIQIAGLAHRAAERFVHGDPSEGRFSVLHLDPVQRLVCGESVNSPADHAALRTLVAHGERIGPALRDEPALSLKALAKTVRERHRRLAS